MSQVAEGKQPNANAIARRLGALEELLDVFREAEDDLMVHALATFKYALCAVLPPSDSPDSGLWGARCISSVLSTVGSLRHHRNGHGAWEDGETVWIRRAMSMLSSQGLSLSTLRELEPRTPLWKQELLARGVWSLE